ncbi:hypothetical protein [Methanoregula sp.]|uniref:hypothetical protein n=1 Tax=Methanoregula sp. TaxID=2052170 RepID=UPI0035643869
MKTGYYLILASCIALILVAGCASVGSSTAVIPTLPAQDPIVDHWAGPMGSMYLSLDVYSNGTADWAVTDSSMMGTMSVPVTWVKNSNSSYTVTTQPLNLITIAGDSMIIGGANGNISMVRGLRLNPK